MRNRQQRVLCRSGRSLRCISRNAIFPGNGRQMLASGIVQVAYGATRVIGDLRNLTRMRCTGSSMTRRRYVPGASAEQR